MLGAGEILLVSALMAVRVRPPLFCAIVGWLFSLGH